MIKLLFTLYLALVSLISAQSNLDNIYKELIRNYKSQKRLDSLKRDYIKYLTNNTIVIEELMNGLIGVKDLDELEFDMEKYKREDLFSKLDPFDFNTLRKNEGRKMGTVIADDPDAFIPLNKNTKTPHFVVADTISSLLSPNVVFLKKDGIILDRYIFRGNSTLKMPNLLSYFSSKKLREYYANLNATIGASPPKKISLSEKDVLNFNLNSYVCWVFGDGADATLINVLDNNNVMIFEKLIPTKTVKLNSTNSSIDSDFILFIEQIHRSIDLSEIVNKDGNYVLKLCSYNEYIDRYSDTVKINFSVITKNNYTIYYVVAIYIIFILISYYNYVKKKIYII